MAQFQIKDPSVGYGLGFDAGVPGAVPWQMVPLYGARGMKLLNGAGAEIEITSDTGRSASDGLVFSEVGQGTASREIWLQGRRKGRYAVHAVRPGSRAVLAMLVVDVFAERLLNLAFYHTGRTPQWEVGKLASIANDILFPQANVRVKMFGSWGTEFTAPLVLPAAVDLYDPQQARALREFGSTPYADAMVYLVNRIAEPPHEKGPRSLKTTGLTVGSQILLDGSGPVSETFRVGRTLAHELGHLISSLGGPSHDGKQDDLMYAVSGHARGTKLRRERVLRFH